MPSRKRRKVPKDKRSRVPKKYLSGTKGSRRSQLANVIKRIAKLYREGKVVPQSLIKERMRLGRTKRARKKS